MGLLHLIRKHIAIIGLCLFLLTPSIAYAVLAGEEDGDPDHNQTACWAFLFANGNFTANADGTCSVADQDGAGSGDNITVNGTTVDSTGNWLDNLYIDWTLTDGGAGGPDDVTAAWNLGETLAGNPALPVDVCIFFSSASGFGMLCEGSTADTNEQLYMFPDVNGADTTEYLLRADDANVSAEEAGYLDGVTSAIQTQLDAKEVQLDNEAGLYAVLSDVTNFLQTGDALAGGDITDGSVDFPEIKFDNTLAGNPAMAVDECYFIATTGGGGIICEGSTANTNEQLYLFPDQDSADSTEYIVVADDANVSAVEAGYLDGVTSGIQTQLDGKEGTLTNSAGLAAALSDETGTGAAVFATSPTLVTPALGTPSSGNASNLTALNATQLTSGTVPAARVGASHIDDAGEIANDLIDSQHYAAGSIDAEHYAGDIEVRSIGITIDGGGSAITTGQKGYIECPYACTISRATVLLDQSGSIVIDVWKDTYANYPPTDADSITASAPPTVTTATKSQDSTLTGWTTSVAAGDILGFNVDSITTATRAHLILKCDIS